MIEQLKGRCVLKQLGSVIVEVGGVGYGVEMHESAIARIEDGEPVVTIWVHTHVREDCIRLFGFLEHAERMLFAQLLAISGVGPKVALGILGAVPLAQLIQAIELDDSAILEEVPGIGPRQSKKILLELKPKLGKLTALGMLSRAKASGKTAGSVSLFDDNRRTLTPSMLADLRSALENFGYKEKELQPLLRRFEREPPAKDLAALIRLALAELAGNAGSVATGRAEELF
jgi:Holliday junction DNA helicase RuvA